MDELSINTDNFNCDECGTRVTRPGRTKSAVFVDLRESDAFPGVIRSFCGWDCAKSASDARWKLPVDR